MAMLVSALRVGGSFTDVTVSRNAELAEANPSLTVIVIVPDPNRFVAGVMVTERFVPLPPNAMFVIGTRLVFEDNTVRVSESGGVSRSLIVNAIGPAGMSSRVIWAAIGEIVGLPLTANVPLTALDKAAELAVICLSAPATSISRLVKVAVPFPPAVPIFIVAEPSRGPAPAVNVRVTFAVAPRPVMEKLPN